MGDRGAPRLPQVEGEYFMVTEIPKNTKPKMEIATKDSAGPVFFLSLQVPEKRGFGIDLQEWLCNKSGILNNGL